MSNSHHDYRSDRDYRVDGFRDLVPLADPYIAALLDKLRRIADSEDRAARLHGELPPPLDSQDFDADDGWPGQWTPRDWPHE